MKRLVLLLTVATILLIGTFTVSAQENQLNVEVNGETIEFTNDSGKPFVDSNYRTQIPVRIVLEKLGINVTWDSLFRVVHTSKEDIECNIPIRQVLEAYGYNVSWDGYKKSVYIYDDDYEAYYNEILEKSNILLEEQQVLQEEQALQKKIEEANILNVMNGYGIVKENTNYNFIEQALTSVNKVHIYKQDKQTAFYRYDLF